MIDCGVTVGSAGSTILINYKGPDDAFQGALILSSDHDSEPIVLRHIAHLVAGSSAVVSPS